MHTHIFRIKHSIEEDRPEIDLELPNNGEAIDWLAVGEVLDGDREAEEWPLVSVLVRGRDAIDWDCYGVGGTLGMYSQRAIEAMGAAIDDFQLFAATMNDVRYYFLRCERKLDCLDHDRSTLVPYETTTGIKDIKKYVFFQERIHDPLVFCIPERRSRLFATQSVIDCLRRAGCRGIDIEQLT
jgi:hypothetical protein